MSGRSVVPRFWICVALLVGAVVSASAQSVPARYERYIERFPDNRSQFERLLNKVDLTLDEVGPAFALVAGVDHYPRLAGKKALAPAGADIDQLVEYLRGQERFVEIVVLRNEAVTLENFDFFLNRYFPRRLQSVPKGRFLFAFSGHGVQEGEFGYLLRPDAERFDAEFGIGLNVVKGFYDRILHHAHQSLVLINACHAGAFLERESFGRMVPLRRGHWAITAGGDAGEVTWHDKKVGPGSIFFEKFLAAMEGRADRLPQQPDGSLGDGLVTVEELFVYLKQEVQLATRQAQNPRLGNISLHGDHGSFFFFDRKRQLVHPRKAPFEGGSTFGSFDCATPTECNVLGTRYQDGVGVVRDDAKALSLFEHACNSGSMAACNNLGREYQNGSVVPRDYSRAARFYRLACDGSLFVGCSNLGALYEHGSGVAQSDSMATELYRKACDGGAMLGCNNLGHRYRLGAGVAEDDAKAIRLFRQSCDGGAQYGCLSLGLMYATGEGVLEDDARAVSLYRQACDGGLVLACMNLGLMYSEGHGVEEDDAKAVRLYRQACESGNMLGCSNLGVMYDRAEGVAKDGAKAASLYRQACEGGALVGCNSLGVKYEFGLDVGKDVVRAERLYRQACDGGVDAACENLERRGARP